MLCLTITINYKTILRISFNLDFYSIAVELSRTTRGLTFITSQINHLCLQEILLNKSASLKESVEQMIQWLTYKLDICFVHKWISVWTNQFN